MSYQITSPNTEAAILARVIQIGKEELSRGAAEYLLSIRFGDADIARMNELSELAREGNLTGEEQAELDSYLHVSNLLAALQSKDAALCSVPLNNQAHWTPISYARFGRGPALAVNTVNCHRRLIQHRSR